jgi:hypothetical protein
MSPGRGRRPRVAYATARNSALGEPALLRASRSTADSSLNPSRATALTMASFPSKWLYRTGWLYSMRSASRRVVTDSQPSASASSRAASRMTWRRCRRSRARRSWRSSWQHFDPHDVDRPGGQAGSAPSATTGSQVPLPSGSSGFDALVTIGASCSTNVASHVPHVRGHVSSPHHVAGRSSMLSRCCGPRGP